MKKLDQVQKLVDIYAATQRMLTDNVNINKETHSNLIAVSTKIHDSIINEMVSPEINGKQYLHLMDQIFEARILRYNYIKETV